MRSLQDETGERKIVFLSQDDKDGLIYMNSDIWITPELKRFKNELLDSVQLRTLNTDTDSCI
jgi:hypothetical protein